MVVVSWASPDSRLSKNMVGQGWHISISGWMPICWKSHYYFFRGVYSSITKNVELITIFICRNVTMFFKALLNFLFTIWCRILFSFRLFRKLPSSHHVYQGRSISEEKIYWIVWNLFHFVLSFCLHFVNDFLFTL